MKIIGVPFSHAMGSKGAEEAPQKIFAEVGITEFEKMEIDPKDVEGTNNLIHDRAKQLFQFGENCVFVGGDHSITYPIFSSFAEKYKDAYLVVFDAHPDCDTAGRNPTNEEWLRAVIEDGFDSKKVILIGTRKVWGIEKDFIDNMEVKVFSDLEDVEAVADYVTEKVNGKPVYISVDFDVMEPAVSPGTYSPEPNGLTSREFFYLTNRLFKTKGLKVLDVCEVVPLIDQRYDFRTVKLAAKLVQDFIGEV